MLTPYDEYPIHQSAYPFSRIPVSDLSWNDGYYFGVLNPKEQIFLYTGIRVTPNANLIGAHAGVSVAGRQVTVRSSRLWRPDFDIEVGPVRYDFAEPFREMRIRLAENDSGLSFDLRWLALADAHLEDHHFAEQKGRITTDQTRYTQIGTADGWIHVDNQEYRVASGEWLGVRDHSWGLYEPRTPLEPKKWLPPVELPERKRALRFWMPFVTEQFTGFYHFHEDEEGNVERLNDVFGTPFEGALDFGFDAEKNRLRLIKGRHSLSFVPGTRMLAGGTVELTDEKGGEWVQEFEVACPPWTTFPIGYYEGTWKDGGSIHTYHQSDTREPHVEWDVVDFSTQPADYQSYSGRLYEGVYGAEYSISMTMRGPGIETVGTGQIEFFMHRSYQPYQPG